MPARPGTSTTISAAYAKVVEEVPIERQLLPVQEHHEIRQDRIGVNAAACRSGASGTCPWRSRRARRKRRDRARGCRNSPRSDRSRARAARNRYICRTAPPDRSVHARRGRRHREVEQRHDDRDRASTINERGRCAIERADERTSATSCLHRPALEGKQPARTLLDEQDDQHQDGDLAEHSAGKRFEELVGDAESEARRPACPRDCRRRRTPRP